MQSAGSTSSFILFQVSGSTYGLPAECVQQMEMLESMTPVPNAAPFVDGIVFSRGQVVPAINLRCRFGFDKIPYDTQTRLIVVSSDARRVGLIADSSREFVAIAADAIHPPPESMMAVSGKYLKGIATLDKRLVLILDLNELLKFTDNQLPASAEA